MLEIAALVVGSEKLTRIFSEWPSFHDAEVHELHLDRGHIDTDALIYEFPRLTVKVHLWLMTSDVDQKGYFVLTNHTLATMRFYDVDNFKMEGFNHQNAIFGLRIEKKTREEGPTPYFAVDFDSSFGMGATFTWLRIEIVEAIPCNAEGTPVL